MGSESSPQQPKPRILCLHGFRTSGSIMEKQVVGKWPQSVTSKLDLYFADAPFPCQGKSDVEGIFDPPYYEWFQFNKGFTEYVNFKECLDYIEDLILKHGPFDGLMGFSQGAILSGALPGLQKKVGLFEEFGDGIWNLSCLFVVMVIYFADFFGEFCWKFVKKIWFKSSKRRSFGTIKLNLY